MQAGQERDSSDRPRAVAVPFVLASSFLVVYWARHLPASLWLDETMTYWTASGGLVESVDRAIRFQGPGPLHYALVWFATRLLPASELVLRAPSVLAFGATCVCLYRVACRLWDRERAVLSVAVLAVLQGMPEASVTARTYALSLFLMTSSTLLLLRWLERQTWQRASAYAVVTALVPYSHVVAGSFLLVHALCLAWLASRKDHAVPVSYALALLASVALLSSPMLVQLRILANKEAIMGFAETPSLLDLAIAWIPPYESAMLAAAVLVARLVGGRGSLVPSRPAAETAVLLGLWYLVPAATTFVASHVLSDSVFAPRFHQWSTLALALAFGGAAGALRPVRARRVSAALLVLLLGARTILVPPHREDWRGAIHHANELLRDHPAPVLAYTGLAESAATDWLTIPSRRTYLLAPFAFYPLVTDPQRWLLPASSTQPGAQRYLQQVVRPRIEDAERVLMILRRTQVGPAEADTSDAHYARRLAAWGFVTRETATFGLVVVMVLERPPATR